MNWVNLHRIQLWVVVFISIVTAGYLGLKIFQNYILIIPLLVFVFILSVWYVIPIKNRTLRNVPYIKTIIVALVWTIFLIVLPEVNSIEITWGNSVNWILFSIYFYTMTLPFDMRDMIFDHPSHQTLPQIIGIKKSKIAGITGLIVFYVFIAFLNTELRTNLYFFFTFLISFILFLGMNKNRGNLYCSLFDLSIGLLGISFLLCK